MFDLFKKKSADKLLQEKSDKEALEKQKQLKLETELKQMKEEIQALFDQEVSSKWFCLDRNNNFYNFNGIIFKDSTVLIMIKYERHVGTEMISVCSKEISDKISIKMEIRRILDDRMRWLELKRQISTFGIKLTYDGENQIP